MVLTYLHFRILKFPLIICLNTTSLTYPVAGRDQRLHLLHFPRRPGRAGGFNGRARHGADAWGTSGAGARRGDAGSALQDAVAGRRHGTVGAGN